jgi:hypothetical protein
MHGEYFCDQFTVILSLEDTDVKLVIIGVAFFSFATSSPPHTGCMPLSWYPPAFHVYYLTL